jgi:hypothetical protein
VFGLFVRHSHSWLKGEDFASRLLQCMSPVMMWWTVPAPSNEVPLG